MIVAIFKNSILEFSAEQNFCVVVGSGSALAFKALPGARMASWQISIQNKSQAKADKGLGQHFRHTVSQTVLEKLLLIPVGDQTPVLLYSFSRLKLSPCFCAFPKL